jgi:hypothetical protein
LRACDFIFISPVSISASGFRFQFRYYFEKMPA